jgi:hypothetical protein
MSLEEFAKPFVPLEAKAKNTQVGYATATAAFNSFATLQQEKRLDQITNVDSAFGTFLLQHKSAPKGQSEKHFKPDVQCKSLGNVKNFLKNKFQHVHMLNLNYVDEFKGYTDLLVSSHVSVATNSRDLPEPQY